MRRVNAKPPAVLGHLHSIAIRAKTQMEKPIFPSPSLSIFTQIASSGKRSHLSGGFWLAILTAAALSLFLIACFLPVRSDLRFEIIIDGGSTGTRIHVFAYAVGQGGMPVLDLGATSTLKENPGLSAYAGNPDLAGESLAGLLDFGKTKVPRSQWGQTKVRVMATAGLRLLDIRVQERILESCRKALRVSGFLFRSEWASVISGTDEGIYAWVAANYALGTLGADPGETTGIIELGGASAQVTFVSNEQLPPEFVHVLRFGKVTYNLYSHSFLHFGQNAAHETFHKILSSRERNSDKTSSTVRRLADPCAPKGFSKGLESVSSQVIATGNFSECRSAVQDLLQKREEDCAYKECRLGSAFVPALHGRFLATENFFFTSKFFRLGRKAILLDFIAAGERFCGQDWMRLKRKYYSMDEDDLPRYCFSSAYIVALLHDGLGVSLDDKRIMYTNKVGNVPLDWALGSFLLLAATTERGRDPGLSSQVSGASGGSLIEPGCSKLSLLAAAVTVMAIVSLGASRWRKTQLRTIYDLERGRYFVTRVVPSRSVNAK